MANLHLEILTPEGLSLWNRLDRAEILLNTFYLAGGTALALQIGHRKSIDFDFFTTKPVEENASKHFAELTGSEIMPLSLSKSSQEFLADRVKIMFWEYHYPLLEELISYNTLKLATPKSIGLFKLIALEGRTTWKDIIDLYFIHKDICLLSNILDEYRKVLPKVLDSFYRNLKNLFNTEDLAKSPVPDMLVAVNKEEALQTVTAEIINYFRII